MERSAVVARDKSLPVEEFKAPIAEHLRELRYRLIIVLLSLLVGVVIGWFGQEWIIRLFQAQVGRLVFFTPAEVFFTKLRIAFSLGLLITLPVLLLQAWLFVLPGLYPDEARLLRRAAPLAYILFHAGLAFGYFVIYPVALQFLLRIAQDGLEPTVSIAGHFNLFSGMILPFGILFQVPLVLYLAARLGLVSPLVLQRRRRHVVFWSVVLAALITPPDGATLFLVAGPMILLFELGLFMARRAAFQKESEV